LADAVAAARSLLFVPGDKPARFAKAEASGADGVVLDLEDAVAAANKDAARSGVAAWLATGRSGTVRVNAADTPWFADDLSMLGGAGDTSVMLPKASVESVAAVVAALGERTRVVVLLETAPGILSAAAICGCPNVIRAAFGSIDLSTELGVDPDDREALLHARSSVVLASAAGGIAAPFDGVTTDVADAEVARADAAYAARLGFSGKLCIHPIQVAAVNAAFDPDSDQIAWARDVLAVEGSGAATVGGHMIDAPVLERARRIIARSAPHGEP
jgi:citrate lyase subunit beta/citryl-CoA lyase